MRPALNAGVLANRYHHSILRVLSPTRLLRAFNVQASQRLDVAYSIHRFIRPRRYWEYSYLLLYFALQHGQRSVSVASTVYEQSIKFVCPLCMPSHHCEMQFLFQPVGHCNACAIASSSSTFQNSLIYRNAYWGLEGKSFCRKEDVLFNPDC